MQNNTRTGISMGLIAALAVCCGAKLLLVTFGLSGLAVLTSQAALIAAAGVATIALVGFLLWRRRSSGCAEGSCSPHVSEPGRQLQAAEPAQAHSSIEPEPVVAGKEQR